MMDIDHSIKVLKELKEIGVQVALDDFGVGYSSFSYLKQLPVDILKTDRSFMKDKDDKNGQAIVAAIVTLGHTLGHKIVAEGVESEHHFAFLNSIFCDEAQGYFFSKPLPSVELFAKIEHVRKFSFTRAG
jgi:EAL domain-containing protein (putative c-di-GMP-specific phosphodiesterase class I)